MQEQQKLSPAELLHEWSKSPELSVDQLLDKVCDNTISALLSDAIDNTVQDKPKTSRVIRFCKICGLTHCNHTPVEIIVDG